MSVLLAAHFTKRFAGGPVIRIDGLELADEPAPVTVLFGASGSGKTTVLRCLAGLERPDEGLIRFGDDVWFDGARGVSLPPRRRAVGLVPQDHALFPHLSVAGNIAYGLHGLPRADQETRVREAMEWLRIAGLETRLPRELSGGQAQRVALARALVCRPRLLLLDEPLGALDAPTRQHLRGELRALLTQRGIPTVLVTHDRMEAAALGDRLVVLDHGRVLQSGRVTDVFNRPNDLATAAIVGTDTVLACKVISQEAGLVRLAAGNARLTALVGDVPANARTVHIGIRAEDVILTNDAGSSASPRNRLPAIVHAITHEGALVRVELDCGFRLKALLTRQACAELALREGSAVTALIKAPQIHVIFHSCESAD